MLDGEAWVSFAGTDTILQRGEELRLGPGRDVAIVSVVGRLPLVFEVLAGKRVAGGALLRPRLLRAVRDA